MHWKNIDVILHYNMCANNVLKSEVVLNSMSEVEYPLKRLSIYVESISEESMSALCNECNGVHARMLGSYL